MHRVLILAIGLGLAGSAGLYAHPDCCKEKDKKECCKQDKKCCRHSDSAEKPADKK
jgi:hypothetical protein